MADPTYLIIGGGMTAAAAAAAIREVDPRGTIGMLSSEPHPRYNRPPLTKALWKGDKLESIWRKLDDTSVSLHLGRTARSLDVRSKCVIDDQGAAYTCDKLLLATGCTPRRLPFGGDLIIYFRTLDDYQRLRRQTDTGDHFAIIGGGFIGTELAASLSANGKRVTLIFPEASIGSRMYPPDLAEFLNGFYREKGVEVLAGATVTDCTMRGVQAALRVQSDAGEREIVVDGVVAGIGVEPKVSLASAAGLKVDNGICVDGALCTSAPGIYAAGDVASFHNPSLNRWMRVEHEDNANTMGKFAGLAMAGRPVSYDHLPFFYSDLFELGYEAVGEVDSRLETVADWKVPFSTTTLQKLKNF